MTDIDAGASAKPLPDLVRIVPLIPHVGERGIKTVLEGDFVRFVPAELIAQFVDATLYS